ncbi:MAG: CapA family protein [Nakamurella sp.]
MTLVVATACAAPVDTTELRVAAAEQAGQTSQTPPTQKPPDLSSAQIERADLALPGCPAERCLSVVVTGDLLLHPPLVEQAQSDGSATGRDLDFVPMLAGLRPFVEPADLAVCHLETPLAPRDGPFEGYPEFSVPPQVLDGLVTTGFDACSTASNHTLDQGSAGLTRTLDELTAAGLVHDGSYRTADVAETPTLATTPNGRVGLISATYGHNSGEPDEPWMVTPLDPAAIVAKAERAKASGADIVIVAMHAGLEYETEPNSDQVDAATTLLASPAIDLVYGHHAHVVQPLDRINGKWAIYGLGNMVAAQETPIDQTHEGLLVRVTFGQDDAGNWSTTDVAWVPSLQRAASPFTWCALGTGKVCSSPDADQIALDRTTEAVNLLGADTAGAHPLTGG